MYRFIFVIIISLFVSCSPPPNIKYSGVFDFREKGENYRAFHRPRNRYKPENIFTGSHRRDKIVNAAQQYIGVKYLYGGASPRGFDCSGLVLYVYKKIGLKLPRSARKQFYQGNRIRIKRARPGDLVFFKTMGSGISHVGIYLGKYKFIHAPSTGKRVRIDSMNIKYWRKRYIGSVSYI